MKPIELTCVAPIFPTPWFPESGMFLKNNVDVMAERGLIVQVVAPMSLGKRIREGRRRRDRAPDLETPYRVVRPALIELPLRFVGENAFTRRLNENLFRRAVERGLSQLGRSVKAVYGHFWIGGYAARSWSRQRGVPYFVELQESGIRGFLNPRGVEREQRVFLESAGVTCVSVDNVRFLEETGVTKKVKARYLPNGFDARKFYKRDQEACRRQLGLPSGGFLVAFAGHFIERKGPLRVLTALRNVPGARGMFFGRGPQHPAGPEVVHAGPILNSELPVWFGAADVFVLPSLAEGLANVTVEAMACGLPLVVSDRPFNRDFLTESEAAFVDPESSDAIAAALRRLQSNPRERQMMGDSALRRSGQFSLQNRADGIREFVSQQLLSHQ